MMKLSTSRKLTIALGSLCVLMMIAVALQKQLGVGTGYAVLPLGPVQPDASLFEPLSESQAPLGDLAFFNEVSERALFDSKRGPMAEADVKPPNEKVTPDVPKVPLTAQLTGIVMTPNHKIALLRAASGDQSFRLREGQPFPGEMGGWRVTQINARSVMFDGGDQGSTELKLDVSKGGPAASPSVMMPGKTDAITAGNPPIPPAAVPMPNPNMPMPQPPMPPKPEVASADQAAREAEVQRIIEERRAQMRAEAERMSAEKQ
jgi:general secretion pathway protein N